MHIYTLAHIYVRVYNKQWVEDEVCIDNPDKMNIRRNKTRRREAKRR